MTVNRTTITTAALLAFAAAIPFRADAGTLRGSPSSMKQQHEVAIEEDLPFARQRSQVEHLVDSGSLVAVEGNADFALSKVSFPYARAEVLLFIESLAAQYRAENGAKLIVTSLTRPADLQPRNAHQLSVHPAGMAVDFRIPATAKQRAWLENALLGLENARVLDVTREKTPPHYHVAVFPAEYLAYVQTRSVSPVKPAPPMASETAPTVRATGVVSESMPAEHDTSAVLIVSSLLGLTLVGVSPLVVKRYSARR